MRAPNRSSFRRSSARPRVIGAAVVMAAAACTGTPAAAGQGDTTQAARLPDGDARAVSRVESYLDGIDTMHARFRQTSSNGARAQGEVWIDRPGKLRFEYDDPTPILLVSNGRMLLHYDKELEQTSYVPISETPLWFLVREDIDLSRIDDYELAKVERGEAGLRLHIVQDGGAPGEPGSLTLVFADEPLRLKQWTVVDQQGIRTRVALMNPKFGVAVDSDRFDFGELDLPDQTRPGKGR